MPNISWLANLITNPLQATALFETIPRWIPIAIIAAGLILYSTPQLSTIFRKSFPEWRQVHRSGRYTVAAMIVSGMALVAYAGLGDRRWIYALFLFGYARAMEGVTLLHFFEKLNRLVAAASSISDSQDNSTYFGLRKLVSWLIGHIKIRLPYVITQLFLLVITILFFISVVENNPSNPIEVNLALTVTLGTFYLSVVGTTWIIRHLGGDISIFSHIGIVLCVTGGELYNIPEAVALVSNRAIGGPIESMTTIIVGLAGWFTGAVLAVLFFQHRIQASTLPTFELND